MVYTTRTMRVDASQPRSRRSSGRRVNRPSRVRFSAVDFAHRIWEALDCPTSLALSLLARAGEWEQVVSYSLAPPASYKSANDFYLAYQAVKLVSKMPGLPTGISTRKRAEKKFVEAEAQCLDTNTRFREYQATGVYPGWSALLHAAQRKIADILGPVPSLDRLDLAFGPGANFGVRRLTTAYHKLSSALESTHSLSPLLGDLLAEVPGWVSTDKVDVDLVYGSDLAFVPKDAKTDRSICIEPLLNGFLQKGIGSYIRERLRRHGVNLADQTINQRMAAMAEELRLSTVDFSSASDTISYALVWDLLPPDWCELLDAARCDSFRYDGRWYPFQKFSSMGNAYTFELETLIFYALAFGACVEEGVQPITGLNLHVYGDDVIIPREAFDRFRAVSTFCGFTLNEEKSYKDGPFFESCGEDVFLGTSVTPMRLKIAPKTHKELTYVANMCLRIATRVVSSARAAADLQTSRDVCDRLSSIHAWVIGFIPRMSRVFGPDSEGDDWLIAPFDRVTPSQGTFGWRHKSFVAQPVKFVPPDGSWPMAYALYGIYRSGSRHACSFLDDAPIRWSEGAALREKVRYRVRPCWSSDWHYPLELTGLFWRGY